MILRWWSRRRWLRRVAVEVGLPPSASRAEIVARMRGLPMSGTAAAIESALEARGIREVYVHSPRPAFVTASVTLRWWARLPWLRGRTVARAEAALAGAVAAGVQSRVEVRP